jgi:RimJ/RimL family protein N-acetyltransferase
MEPPAPWTPPGSSLKASFELEGITLRYWTADDAPGILEALRTDRASYLPWLPWVAIDNRNLAEVTFNVERFRRDRERIAPVPDDFVLGIFDSLSGEPLGGTGFHRIRHAWHEAEVGYWVRADRRGLGVCTRATRAALSWGFTPQRDGGWGFRRVKICCASANAASRRVPEKIGLRLESHVKAERWLDGMGWSDSLQFGVLSSEWDRARSRMLVPAGPG